MANAKEIRLRMNSIRDTQKITNAMYLIASAKMRKAKSELDRTRPYFTALQAEIKRIFRTAGDVESKYFYPADGSRVLNHSYACLVITADKGLAGAYNQNVIKKAEQQLSEHPDTKLFVVGEYGRQYFRKHHIPVERSFLYTAQNPTLSRAREISAILLDLFVRNEADKIFVIYTDLKGNMEGEAKSTRILPFHRQHFASNADEKAVTSPFEFFPSVGSVLDNVMQSYVSGFIYSALVDSFCSEQNARMTAMNSANQNAEKMLHELSVQYNRVRQAAITREITEVSSGAMAQKKKRLKRQLELEEVENSWL
ncbi:MAG: ATP synthase F1 subunit gamma [Butyrivibrio sp.]|nr:ATP synthase F1 subunit gamma [Acetatifactor muris]MCM1560414.1 ATP synthase F1 subunit gamma [Butyrivibrio sp.]